MSVQLLTNYNAPSINGINAQRITANQILENLYQGLIESDGKGITQRFSSDTSGAQIQVYHAKPVYFKARELGSAINGGNFNGGGHEIETDAVGIDVLTTFDDPIRLAQVSADMIPVDLLNKAIKSYTDQVNANINGMTIGGKYMASLVRGALDGEDTINTTYVDLNGDFKNAVIDANSKLDDGAEEVGVTMFPQNDRICVIQASLRGPLINKGVLVVGGANYGYDILRKGTLDAGATPRKEEDGYVGTIDNVETHVASKYIFSIAADYMGLPKADLQEHLLSYVSSGFANIRAIASVRSVKYVDTLGGQGIEAQPLTRAGFKVFEGYEKGNSLILKTGSLNIVDELKKLFALGTTGLTSMFKSKGIASRIALLPTLTSSASTKVTVTCANASKIAVVVVPSTTIIKCADDFLVAYNGANANARNNAVTSGSEITLAGATSGKVAYALCLASDGTVDLGKVVIA